MKFYKDGTYSISKPEKAPWTAGGAQQNRRFKQVKLLQK